tara:strand:+ start:331 stop:636 length:306 start_codon:yes stop_codon:yes gene_type:complete
MAIFTDSNGPLYYKRGACDVWDFIRDQGLNFHLGNAVKYICRAGYKDSKIKDLEKAIHYLQNELEHAEDLYLRSGEGIPINIWDSEQPSEAPEFTSEGSDS